MKIKVCVILLLLFAKTAYSQDYTFTFIENYNGQARLKRLSDSLGRPLLLSMNKVYSIGSNCITRLLNGELDDRDDDGDVDDRGNDGNANQRLKAGKNDERTKSGGVGDRQKKGKNNNRRKGGDDDDRDSSGDVDTRNLAGGIGLGNRCSVAKNGKVLLYTRQKMDSRNSTIFFHDKSFNNRYFKIIQL
jgi:hypothetical protein